MRGRLGRSVSGPGAVSPAWPSYCSAPFHVGQGVERLEAVVGERVVVDEQAVRAGEEGAGSGDVEVVQGLGRVGLDLGDPDQAAKRAECVARLELAGHGPAEV